MEGLNPSKDANYDIEMRKWRDEAYEEALRFKRLSPEEPRVKTHMKFIEGNHWEQFGRRAKYKSNFYINKTGTARLSHLAVLTDTRPDINVSCNIPEYEEDANRINDVITAEYINNNSDLTLASIADISSTCGTGFGKTAAWYPGYSSVQACGPDMVMPIQPGFSIQESTAVLYQTYKSLTWAMRECPQKAAQIERNANATLVTGGEGFNKPEHIDSWTWQRMAPQMKRLVGTRIPTVQEPTRGLFRSVLWQEYWVDDLSKNESSQTVIMRDPNLSLDAHNWWYRVEPGERLYPRKRLVTFAGDTVVYDGPNPYWHGQFPFPCLRLNPVFWNFWGLSKYRDMIPVNAAINEIICGVLDIIKKILNPTMVVKGSSVSREAWKSYFGDMPGARLMLNGNMADAQKDVQFASNPELPGSVLAVLMQFLGPEFDKLSGNMDVQALNSKGQVPGGDTIEQMRDSAQSPFRLEGRYIEVFLRDTGIQQVSNVIQFYNAKRRMALIGAGGISPRDLEGSPLFKNSLVPQSMEDSQNYFDYWKQFPVKVTPGSMHGGAKDRSKMLKIQLWTQGGYPLRRLLTDLDIGSTDNIIEEIMEEMKARVTIGGPAVPGGSPRLSRGQRNGSPA
jgi:hypothetical protein